MKSPGSPLSNRLSASVMAFRLGMEGQAHEDFASLIDALGEEFKRTPVERLNEVSLLLPDIFAAQNRQDFLGLADLLEYHLAPLLGLN